MEPILRSVNLLGLNRLKVYNQILWDKSMIREVFEDFYRTCLRLDKRHFSSIPGKPVEIGAGTRFFKKIYPELITSDIGPARYLDQVVDAQAMLFGDQSMGSPSQKCLFCVINLSREVLFSKSKSILPQDVLTQGSLPVSFPIE